MVNLLAPVTLQQGTGVILCPAHQRAFKILHLRNLNALCRNLHRLGSLTGMNTDDTQLEGMGNGQNFWWHSSFEIQMHKERGKKGLIHGTRLKISLHLQIFMLCLTAFVHATALITKREIP